VKREYDGHVSAGLAGVVTFCIPRLCGTVRARGPTSAVGSDVFSFLTIPYEEPVVKRSDILGLAIRVERSMNTGYDGHVSAGLAGRDPFMLSV
jgi:hypothetical protein